jgi:hypothetical protein
MAGLHALLVRDLPHLPRLMQRVGADDAALAAHGLGSSWVLGLLLRHTEEKQEEKEKLAV